MIPKRHSDPEQSEGEESIVIICFCLLVHFIVFKYFLPCKKGNKDKLEICSGKEKL
jgi:hypothetical protein